MAETPEANPARAPLIKLANAPLPAKLITDACSYDGFILRQSATGVVVHLASQLPLDAKLALALPGTLHSGGRVQWRQGPRHGIAFEGNRDALKGALTRWRVTPQPGKDLP